MRLFCRQHSPHTAPWEVRIQENATCCKSKRRPLERPASSGETDVHLRHGALTTLRLADRCRQPTVWACSPRGPASR